MSIKERVESEIANAMRARDQVRLSAFRLLKTALTNREIQLGHNPTPAEEAQVVQSLAKQRQDSIEQFGRAGRADLVAKETAELHVLQSLLPPQMSDETLDAIVTEAVVETGASSAKDMGKVMKAVMARLEGQVVDGKKVNERVRARLAGG
ncbi:MAG: GatB/YqeY domain-containing protein [Vicinamibacterales bacterium]